MLRNIPLDDLSCTVVLRDLSLRSPASPITPDNSLAESNMGKRKRSVMVKVIGSESDSSDEEKDEITKEKKKKSSNSSSSYSGKDETSSCEEKPALRRSARISVRIKNKEVDNTEENSESEEWTPKKAKKETSDSEEETDKKPIFMNGDSKSEYEKMVERNKAERMAFLKSLKLDEAKAELEEVIEKVVKKKKVQPFKKVFKKRDSSPPVLRKSRRLAKLDINLSEDALFDKAMQESKDAEAKKTIPPKLPLKEALYFEELYENFTKDINIQKSDKDYKFISYDREIFTKLNLEDSNIAKVTPDRITALSWHPDADTLILAAGSKYGNLGLWNVDSESDPYVLKIHLDGITNMRFNPLNPVQLVSSSYDGTLRCGDMVEQVFNEIYQTEDSSCTYFDFLSQSTFLVAQRNGQVAIVDNKTRKQCEKKHDCHKYSVKTVQVHPVKQNYFLTAENKGPIRLWDLRKLQEDPVVEVLHHKRSVNSAFFSPVTGNSLLTTSMDDTVCIYDTTKLAEEIPLRVTMKHNNNTGRWLSIFRAKWLPNSDDAFLIGSMQEPRRIQVYDSNMNIQHVVMHENFTTISSINECHPFRHALAGGNSSGKVFVFI